MSIQINRFEAKYVDRVDKKYVGIIDHKNDTTIVNVQFSDGKSNMKIAEAIIPIIEQLIIDKDVQDE